MAKQGDVCRVKCREFPQRNDSICTVIAWIPGHGWSTDLRDLEHPHLRLIFCDRCLIPIAPSGILTNTTAIISDAFDELQKLEQEKALSR